MIKLKEKDDLIPGTYDVMFKAIVMHPNCRGAISSLLSEYTKLPKNLIFHCLRFLNTELPVENYYERRKTTDILADVDGNIINLEMNQFVNQGQALKSYLYHHKIVFDKYLKGDQLLLNNIWQLNFDKQYRFGNEEYVEFTLRDKYGHYTDEENFKRIYINLEKALKKYYNKEELTKAEKVLVMLQLRKRKALREISKGDKELEAMARTIEDLNENPYIIGLYDKEKMDKAVNDFNLQHERNLGIEEGRKEILKETVLNMLKKNMDIDTISDVTGLAKEEIEKLK